MATTAELLQEARTAQHKLLTGQMIVKFRDQNGEELSYSVANKGALATYIADLERQLNTGTPTGPMRVWF